MLGDDVDAHLRGHGDITFREGFCYLLYMPANILHQAIIKKGSTAVIHLELPPAIISELVNTHSWLERFLQNYSSESPNSIAHQEIRITPEMYKEIDRIKSYSGDKRDFEYFLKIRTEILLFEYVNAVANIKDNAVSTDNRLLSTVERILLATKTIDNHQGPKLSVPEISRLVGLSRRDLQKGFKSLHRLTVDKYQTLVRMEHAQRLLIDNPGLPIREIAEIAGYTEESNFSKVFKNHNKRHLTPLQYRKKYEK
jgi:AraC-like DNA-binding protein